LTRGSIRLAVVATKYQLLISLDASTSDSCSRVYSPTGPPEYSNRNRCLGTKPGRGKGRRRGRGGRRGGEGKRGKGGSDEQWT
jgi:hypothetical protein